MSDSGCEANNSQFANYEFFVVSSSPLALRPQDVVVLLKLVALGDARRTHAALAKELGISLSEVHQSLDRAVAAGLARKEGREPAQPVRAALKEFVLHGVRYAFPASLCAPTRGVPTAYAGPPLRGQLSFKNELPPVWPDPEGDVRGLEVEPLYKSVPAAARRDALFYELLALVDSLRIGRARERKLAEAELGARLK